jgi:hypothetical protein
MTVSGAGYDPTSREVALNSQVKRTETQRLHDMATCSELMLRGWSYETIFAHLIEEAKKFGFKYTKSMFDNDIKKIKNGYINRIETNTEEYRALMVARINMERAEIWKWIARAEEEPVETSSERKEGNTIKGKDGKPVTVGGHTRVSKRTRARRAPVGLFERLADLNKLEIEITGIRKPVVEDDYDEAVWRPGGQKVIPYESTAELLMKSLGETSEIIDAEFSG